MDCVFFCETKCIPKYIFCTYSYCILLMTVDLLLPSKILSTAQQRERDSLHLVEGGRTCSWYKGEELHYSSYGEQKYGGERTSFVLHQDRSGGY